MAIGMAKGAGQGGMFAGLSVKLSFLRIVAGQTRSRQLTGECNLKRLVRIVAANASSQFIMSGPGMTHAAFGNIIYYLRRMTDMAILAGDGRLVLRAQSSNIRRFLVMTFDAIGISQQ